jgi:3'-5' exoribonuclease 1
LFPQCVLAKTAFPPYATKWVDVRKMFSSFYRVPSGNIPGMLENLELSFEGRQHSGIADARNIARVLVQLIRDGCIIKYNRFIPNDALERFKIREYVNDRI